MPDHRRTRCQHCRRHKRECGPISWRGCCAECGDARALENARGISSHAGPVFARWRRGMAASVGAILLDDAADDG